MSKTYWRSSVRLTLRLFCQRLMQSEFPTAGKTTFCWTSVEAVLTRVENPVPVIFRVRHSRLQSRNQPIRAEYLDGSRPMRVPDPACHPPAEDCEVVVPEHLSPGLSVAKQGGGGQTDLRVGWSSHIEGGIHRKNPDWTFVLVIA